MCNLKLRGSGSNGRSLSKAVASVSPRDQGLLLRRKVLLSFPHDGAERAISEKSQGLILTVGFGPAIRNQYLASFFGS